MKKSLLVAIVLLASSHLFAADKLNCVVHKFTPNGEFNHSDDRLITFKSTVESGQFLIIDENGVTKIQAGYQKNEIRNIFWISKMSDLVGVLDAKAGISAMGNKGANMTNHRKGLAVTCGLANLPK